MRIYIDPGPAQLSDLLEMLAHIAEGSIDGRTIKSGFAHMDLFENSEVEFAKSLAPYKKQQFFPFYLKVSPRIDVAPATYRSRVDAFVETLQEVGIQANAESGGESPREDA